MSELIFVYFWVTLITFTTFVTLITHQVVCPSWAPVRQRFPRLWCRHTLQRTHGTFRDYIQIQREEREAEGGARSAAAPVLTKEPKPERQIVSQINRLFCFKYTIWDAVSFFTNTTEAKMHLILSLVGLKMRILQHGSEIVKFNRVMLPFSVKDSWSSVISKRGSFPEPWTRNKKCKCFCTNCAKIKSYSEGALHKNTETEAETGPGSAQMNITEGGDWRAERCISSALDLRSWYF